VKFTIERLLPELEGAYESFVHSIEDALLYSSLKYRNLLKGFLGASVEDHYFIARSDNGVISAALPSFVCHVEGYGPVANSLPFYGSNGGVIVRSQDKHVVSPLLHHFRNFTDTMSCSSATVITSPFQDDLEPYEACLAPTHKDSRIGQVTRLPTAGIDPEKAIMASLHHKTRNMVRKAIKQNIKVTHNPWEGAFRFLATTHADNISALGGKTKPLCFFQAIQSTFSYGRDYRIYTAWHDDMPIAALLVFYFNKTVEYFTPAIVQAYKTWQPMSLLIFNAMADSITQGFAWWNWGGTWRQQTGVYQFKRSWGALDKPYSYYTRVVDSGLMQNSLQELQSLAPYFFIAPYDQLPSMGFR